MSTMGARGSKANDLSIFKIVENRNGTQKWPACPLGRTSLKLVQGLRQRLNGLGPVHPTHNNKRR